MMQSKAKMTTCSLGITCHTLRPSHPVVDHKWLASAIVDQLSGNLVGNPQGDVLQTANLSVNGQPERNEFHEILVQTV